MAWPEVIPYIRYQDPKAMIDWLERAFGFKEHAVHEDDNGTVVHAEVTFGSGMFMLGAVRDRGGSRRALRARPSGRRGDHSQGHRPGIRLARLRRPRSRGPRLKLRDLPPGVGRGPPGLPWDAHAAGPGG